MEGSANSVQKSVRCGKAWVTCH